MGKNRSWQDEEYEDLSPEFRDELEREDYELEEDRRISNQEWEEEKERRERERMEEDN